MAAGANPDMSDYERRAWQALIDHAHATDGRAPRYGEWAQSAKGRVKKVAVKARTTIGQVPGADQAFEFADAAASKAMAGLHTTLVERGLNSVRPVSIFKAFGAEGVDVVSYDDVRKLDLKVCDRSVPRRKERYIGLAITEGAASSLAVSGAVVSATVTGGTTAAVAVGAVVADVTAVMVGMGRIVALVAAHYGYDVRDPEEQAFASGVLAYSSAGSSAEKAASLASLSRLTQHMMRRATWRQLQQHQMVNVIQRMSMSLGFNLTKRKLAQAVPVVGVVVNGGLNARIVHKTFSRAQHAYRLRFLSEKYGLDAAAWSPDLVDAQIIDIPLIDEIIDAEIDSDSSPKGDDSQTS